MLQNLQVVNFSGNALAANNFSGEMAGYNVTVGKSGGNCLDMENTQNPYRFYGLVASHCTNGINLVNTKGEEFHGASVFSNSNNNVSVTGAFGINAAAYILFDGLQMGASKNANMYLDQSNEVVLCAANCFFKDAGKENNMAAQPALEIGIDATNMGNGTATPIIAQFNQGAFTFNTRGNAKQSSTSYDVQFDGPPSFPNECACAVALGSGMLSLVTGNGIPDTTDPTRTLGQSSYTPPTFANGASVGVPLTLGTNELGIGASTDSEGPPNGSGLKLRVECSGSHTGKVKIVALAGNSTSEALIADNVGGSVGACQ